MLHCFYFSPSGTTKATVDIFACAFGNESVNHNVTCCEEIATIQAANDVVLLACPVYAGRVPSLAAERFSHVRGNGQKAVAMVVYGNRDYDDALLELCDIAQQQGFEVVAAGAFIAEHCIFPKVAANRPDAEDEQKILQFAEAVKELIPTDNLLDLSRIKGNRPYKKAAGVPLHPKVDIKACNSCGTCAKECPTGAIGDDNPQATDSSKCITCCRCIHVCPRGARHLGGLLYSIAGWKFTKDNSRRLEPEWFI